MSHSLATRLIVWSLVVTGAVYLLTIGLSNRAGRQTAIAAAQREAYAGADAAARSIDDVLHAVEESGAALGRTVSELEPDRDALGRLVERFSSDARGAVTKYQVVAPADDAPPWYREAYERGTPGWSEPYRDVTTENATIVTWSGPVRSGGLGPFVAASVRLDFLSSVLREVQPGTNGFALVLSRQGLLIAHTRRDLSKGIHDPLAELSPELRSMVAPIVDRARAGESGFEPLSIDGEPYRVTFRPISRTGWSLATAYAERDVLEDVASLRRTQIALAVAGLLILGMAVVMLSRRITRPLVSLAASAGHLATGDLDAPLPDAATRDEIGALTTTFHHMRDSLKDYIRNLQETTAAKERLEGEMKAARRIQADMLPAPEAGSGPEGYQLSAVLVPALAVGGDLFHHFEHQRRVFFLVGDVSGKGVAAALFMARTKTLFDAVAATQRDPGGVLAALNDSLCRQNESGMYVTVVCGALNLDTGVVCFATAGHEPPVIVGPGRSPHPLETEGGPILGLLPIASFPVSSVTLHEGAALVMYTDGVSEARDAAGGFFGSERLLEATAHSTGGDAAAITAGLLRAVKAFAADAPQSDDITILTLRLTRRPIREVA
jgi:sigma-B regulation protein RsbU (phosphoserine phosphatase)